MKYITTVLSLLVMVTFSFGQSNPVTFNISQDGDVLVFDAKIESGWHLYAANLPNPNEGPLSTEIVFQDQKIDNDKDGVSDNSVKSNGKIIDSEGIREMDDAFGVEVIYFKDEATFKVPFEINIATANPLAKGVLYYMVCNDESCIPFEEPFELKITQSIKH